MSYLEVRHVDISARRTDHDGHDIIDLSAFNTDGFDVTGDYVWIHDCTVWNQDDCVCAKDGSTNMLFERINASGVGLTIGSIGGSTNKKYLSSARACHRSSTTFFVELRRNSTTFQCISINSPYNFDTNS